MLTDGQRKELVDRYLNTKDPVREIISDFDIYPSLFYSVLREEGVEPRRKPGRSRVKAVSPQEVAEVYLGEPETPVEEIAESFGVSVALVYRRLAEAGVSKDEMRGSGRRPKPLPVDEIAEAYNEGARLEDFAEEYDVSYDTVRRRLLKAGYEIRPPGHQEVDLPVEEIVSRYERGEHLRQIAEDYPVSHETIRQRLLDAGVDIRDRSCGDNTKTIPTEEIAEKYYDGACLSDLAEEYGVSATTIRKRLRRNGHECRRCGPPKIDLPVEKMAEDYRQGLSLSDLAEKYPASIMTIRRRLIEAGVKIRPPYQHNGGDNGNSNGERSLVQSQGT